MCGERNLDLYRHKLFLAYIHSTIHANIVFNFFVYAVFLYRHFSSEFFCFGYLLNRFSQPAERFCRINLLYFFFSKNSFLNFMFWFHFQISHFLWHEKDERIKQTKLFDKNDKNESETHFPSMWMTMLLTFNSSKLRTVNKTERNSFVRRFMWLNMCKISKKW